ncbi:MULTISPECIES: tripartite tricarboxylate transporter permease [Paracoccus]|jgi:putative tricarboxylic transport membrane protein|uniref:C4-dicarboxylate ABC transporter permease n=1 Tax=Paracoccus litorisediminis TaxID=2006130 RepID=A0A844HJE8_9RHOB|nr:MULTISPECIES: tripartite tricarboxylate transporter permease [Paracoccus]MBD9528158.1 tripartite tricarboxylate transporter permease [Paracoccus sp. PAR01]MTH59138.1 C4-dicarboxylate ABC transporter permease [Paracoccus litorisediminis]
MSVLAQSFAMVFDPQVLLVMLLSGAFGLFVGAIPGLTATMATALLVPITFFMEPIAAIASIVTASAMAIFSGDIPGALLRIPGTPASAAYVEDSYRMTRAGRGPEALGALLVFSVIGGIFGTIVLIVASPILAEMALKFSSFEYFWLVLLGLSAAIFVSPGSVPRGLVALIIGLVAASVGMDNPTAEPRFTFGNLDLLGGISFIPAMIGLFALAEVFRYFVHGHKLGAPLRPSTKGMLRSQIGVLRRYPKQMLRGNITGTLIGALPGAGADIAAWISYAMSKRFSREPEKFGKGHVEGLVEAGASNNAAVSGAWIPALVFGIPGDSITAIVIGVLYIKGMNPGPTIFINQAELINALFIVFLLANLLMIPLGWLAIRASTTILAVPQKILMPIITLFCIVGAFAITNSVFGIILMLAFGVLGFLMEENDIPIAPAILGLVLGPLLEQHFITSMIKADGNLLSFFERPIAAGLGIFTILVWCAPLIRRILIRRKEALT